MTLAFCSKVFVWICVNCGMMIVNNELYCLISVWRVLSFIHGPKGIGKQELWLVLWRPMTVKWWQSNCHSTIGTRQTEYHEALPSFCIHTSLRHWPTMVMLHDTRFVECWWWNDDWTVKPVVTWWSLASMIPAPGLINQSLEFVAEMRILVEMKIENHGKIFFPWEKKLTIVLFSIKIKMMDLWMQIGGTKLIFVMNFSVQMSTSLSPECLKLHKF